MHDDLSLDPYEAYELQFDPLLTDRQARRQRKPDVNPKVRILAKRHKVGEISDLDGLEGGFKTTYHPSRHEEGWLLESLRGFYEEKQITDVLSLARGGKEASVYRCAGHESTGQRYLAAKVYRPRQFRSLSNDALYKEGRGIIAATGHEFGKEKERIERAIGKKSAFGQQVAHTSWLMHECTAIRQMSAHGAAVPRVHATAENAILMDFIGDANRPAPALNEVALAADEVRPLFSEVMRNVKLLLNLGWIHGDLSAYNILYHAGAITLIDFPQVVAVAGNSQARAILSRDVERVCEYFATQGLERDPDRITDGLWRRFRPRSEREVTADLSRRAIEEDDE